MFRLYCRRHSKEMWSVWNVINSSEDLVRQINKIESLGWEWKVGDEG